MVSELRAVADALSTLTGVSVLRTRWYAEKINAELPAIIIDYSRPEEPLLMENGIPVEGGDYFYLELAVSPISTADPLEALERLETLIEQALSALRTAFPNNTILFIQPETVEMPFAKQTSLSFICDLFIG